LAIRWFGYGQGGITSFVQDIPTKVHYFGLTSVALGLDFDSIILAKSEEMTSKVIHHWRVMRRGDLLKKTIVYQPSNPVRQITYGRGRILLSNKQSISLYRYWMILYNK
jgi:hypothetical protein